MAVGLIQFEYVCMHPDLRITLSSPCEYHQILQRVVRSPAQASFVRCICGVDKRQESSEDACRPCDRSAAASASSRR
eukprot:COSAG02_NODE_24568_length_684_cov_0.919658_2_plen_76_part_01